MLCCLDIRNGSTNNIFKPSFKPSSKTTLCRELACCGSSFDCNLEKSKASGDVIKLIKGEFGSLCVSEGHRFVSELWWFVCGR